MLNSQSSLLQESIENLTRLLESRDSAQEGYQGNMDSGIQDVLNENQTLKESLKYFL